MSETEEMYLVSIARLHENGIEGPVALPLLADELNIAPVSANQKIRKLEQADLVNYIPYKGAELTESGYQIALRILRHRRLWEVFLVEKLHFSPEEAERLACRMEHIIPDEAADRLAVFLGDPQVNPRGIPIPATSATQIRSDIPLDQVRVNQTYQITRLCIDTASRVFLAEEGISQGEQITALAAADHGMLVKSMAGKPVHISKEIAKSIWVNL